MNKLVLAAVLLVVLLPLFKAAEMDTSPQGTTEAGNQAEQASAPAEGAAPEEPEASAPVTVDLAYLTKYLDRMGLKYEANLERGFAHMVMAGDHGKYDTYVVTDTESALAFIIISDYMTVRADHRNCDKVLRRLMELNWKLNVGKFEWDPSDGEVRITFTFSTENGVGYEAFKAVFETLAVTADQYKEELERLLVSD